MAIDRIVQPREERPGERGFLTGRAALVTGGARRIGRALALALAEQGADLVIHFHESRVEAEETAREISKLGGWAKLLAGDLADPSVADGLVDQAAATIGRPIDILINNASVFAQGSARETTTEQWDLNQAVNLRAPFLLSRALERQLPSELSENQPADIINLNDYRALNPGADHFAYTISKVGLHGLTSSLAQALAPAVRVNELALGAVLPPEKAPEDYLHTLKSEILTGKFPQIADVTSAMLFLLGNSAITGQTICIDGGRK